MTTWPSFARYLDAANPVAGMSALLDEMARVMTSSTALESLLGEFFGEDPVVTRIAPHVAGFDHVGVLAPVGVGVADAKRALVDSPFRHGLRQFRSRILAADLSARLGRVVVLDVAEAWMASESGSPGPGFEWFVSDLPDHELGGLVREEVGCHVGLRLRPGSEPARLEEIVRRATRSGVVVGPLRVNEEIGVRLFYFDRTDESGRTRRLEVVAPG